MIIERSQGCLLFDWGNTLMVDFPDFKGPMFKWPQVEAVENASQVLAALSKNWFIALATNAQDSSKEEIMKALERVDLLKYLPKIYCSKSVGYAKPSLEFFFFILKDLGLAKEEIFMIGDDFEKDIQGANRFGIPAIWFNQKDNKKVENNLCRTIYDLKELPECLKEFRKNI